MDSVLDRSDACEGGERADSVLDRSDGAGDSRSPEPKLESGVGSSPLTDEALRSGYPATDDDVLKTVKAAYETDVVVGRDESDLEAEEAGRATTMPESSEAATLSDSTPPWTEVDADVDDDDEEADGGAMEAVGPTPTLDKSPLDLAEDRCDEKRGGGGGCGNRCALP